MKKHLLATVSVLAIATGASAADLTVKAPYRPVPVAVWAGWYVGLQGGIVSHRGEFNDFNFTVQGYPSTRIGSTAGVNFGWLGQQGSLVYGVEADWMWVGAKAGATWAFLGTNPLVTSFDPSWIATVRGKAGLAFDATLVYITGGVAFGHVKNSAVRPGGGGAFDQNWTENTTRVGWTMGFGVAHQVTSNWTVRAEGRYVDLGKSSVDCTTAGPAFSCANGGVNYKGEFANSLFMGLVGVDFKF